MVSVLCQELWNPSDFKVWHIAEVQCLHVGLGLLRVLLLLLFLFPFSLSKSEPDCPYRNRSCFNSFVGGSAKTAGLQQLYRRHGIAQARMKYEHMHRAPLEEQSQNFRKICSWGSYFITVWRVTGLSSHTHGHEDMVFNTFYIYIKKKEHDEF